MPVFIKEEKENIESILVISDPGAMVLVKIDKGFDIVHMGEGCGPFIAAVFPCPYPDLSVDQGQDEDSFDLRMVFDCHGEGGIFKAGKILFIGRVGPGRKDLGSHFKVHGFFQAAEAVADKEGPVKVQGTCHEGENRSEKIMLLQIFISEGFQFCDQGRKICNTDYGIFSFGDQGFEFCGEFLPENRYQGVFPVIGGAVAGEDLCCP
jgi:hypothetical protein